MTQAKCSILYRLLFLFIASVTCSTNAQISVTGSGAGPLTFDATPAATDFSTAVLTGGATTYTDATTMDAGSQTVDASTVTRQLPASGTVPPSAFSGGMRHNTAAFYLQSRPTTDGTNAAGVMMATLRNDTGGGVLSFMVSYDFGINNAAAGEIPGFRVYYSLSGSPGSWQVIPSLSDSETAGLHSATVTVGSWSPGTSMYLLWADDNANGITDPSYTIDNFTISAITPDTLTCVAITNQSASISIPERGTATFSLMATGSPQNIQWFRDGLPISGATTPTYTIPSVVYPTDNNVQFYATVTNSLCAATSAPVTLTVVPDTTPPTVIRAVAEADPTKVTVTFSEPMDPNFINENNFTVFPTGTDPDASPYISFTAISTDGTNVVISTDARVAGVNHSVRVLDLRDASSGNNLINPNPLLIPLLATLELIGFDNNNEWKYFIGSDIFGTGWETVGYDDSAWLSGPAGLGLDSSVNGVPIRTTLPYTAQSEPVYFRKHFTLPAKTNGLVLSLRDVVEDGAVYYINGQEAFRHNVSAGALTYASRSTAGQADPTPIQGPFILPITNLVAGDNVLAVVVLQSGGTSSDIELAVELHAVVTEFLSGPAKIVTAPQPLTVNEGQTASFSVVAEGELPLNYQWRKGGVDLEGQTNSGLTFSAALPTDAGDYTVFVSNALGNTNSPIAHLTVNADVTAPTFVSAVASTNLTNITLTITDAFGLNVASAEDVSHYSVALTAGGGNLTILSATLVNASNVVLTTSERVQGQAYTIVLNNIRDRSAAGNLVTPTTRAVNVGIVVLAPNDVTLWRYDSSSNILDGLGWELPGFNDLAWPTALAGFTSSNALEITTNGFELRTTNMLANPGPNTVYYRVNFNFPGSTVGAALRIVGVIDDGLVAYINGVEAGRLRITNASPVSFTNLATAAGPETADVHLPLESVTLTNLSGLVQGDNLLAIELHQNSLTSSDAVLSIQLVAEIQTFGPVVEGPVILITRNTAGQVTISWTGGGTLQETSALLNGGATVWVPSARQNGVPFTPPAGPNRFYRVAQ